ncbi:hypothetical protein B0O99DRAFT_50447 [Bisporella sp. PMI_857]|nr:hypothetical protein B0O99DRAFT_50447 [Bisporella sp. PMI_857]
MPACGSATQKSDSRMAAIPSIQLRSTASPLAKRGNWASREPGVIVVFCIVFVVACGLLGLYISRWLARRRARREDF